MGWAILSILLTTTCGGYVGPLGQPSDVRRVLIQDAFPQGWPEFGLTPEELAGFSSKSLSKLTDGRASRTFWEAFRVVVEGVDPSHRLKSVVQLDHPFYQIPLALLISLTSAVEQILRYSHHYHFDIDGPKLSRSFKSMHAYSNGTLFAFVDVYLVAAHLAAQGMNISKIHWNFYNEDGRSVREADILIRKNDGTYEFVEVKRNLHRSDKDLSQIEKLEKLARNARRAEESLHLLISRVWVITTSPYSAEEIPFFRKRFPHVEFSRISVAQSDPNL